MDYFEEKTHQVEPEELTAFGIKIFSRYGKAHEICEMLSFCRILAENEIICVTEVFYDSKACLCSFTFDPEVLSKSEEDLIFQAAEKTIGQFCYLDGTTGGYQYELKHI